MSGPFGLYASMTTLRNEKEIVIYSFQSITSATVLPWKRACADTHFLILVSLIILLVAARTLYIKFLVAASNSSWLLEKKSVTAVCIGRAEYMSARKLIRKRL